MKLVRNKQVDEVDELETSDPDLLGKMTMTITLAEAKGGTDLVAVDDGLPRVVSKTDNETGWRMALEQLTKPLEQKNE